MRPGLAKLILGERYSALPRVVQSLHDPQPRLCASGRCAVARGKGFLVALICWLMGFPKAGADLPMRFEIEARDDAEHWRRQFGASRLNSVFRAQQGLLREWMGPMCLEQSLEPRADGLHFVLRRAWFLGIPVPRFLLPKVRAVASEIELEGQRRYGFEVATSLPLIGPVMRYQGWLEIAA